MSGIGASTDKTAGSAPANILLVDDTPSKLLTYEIVLAELGENLIKASSVEDALRRPPQTDVALLLTDISMPGADGFKLARLAREHPRFREIRRLPDRSGCARCAARKGQGLHRFVPQATGTAGAAKRTRGARRKSHGQGGDVNQASFRERRPLPVAVRQRE